VFFIPECEQLPSLRLKIEENGGLVVDQHECFTYQIKPENAMLKARDFYRGILY